MNAVIYARYSSDNQTEMSIDAQIRACTEYAVKHGLNIIRTYTDEAISGTTNKRPGYQQMLTDAFNEEYNTILIHKYDRIARSLEEQVNLRSKLKQLNIKLIAVAQDYGEGKDAELSKGIQWVLGEYYSANLAEETRKGHKELALKGMHNGGVAPFGYDVVDRKYQINELEAYYVRWMFRSCINGESYKEVIDAMAKANIIGKRGKPIGYNQIYDILRNEKYTGTYVYCEKEPENREERRSKPNAIRIYDAFPAIVDYDTWTQAQNIINSRRHSGPSHKHRCSGLVYCAECGAKMYLHRSTRKGHHYSRYVCSAKCGAPTILIEEIDAAVDAYLDELFSEKNIADVETALKNFKQYNKNSKEALRIEQNRRLKKVNEEIQNITQILLSGKFLENASYYDSLLSQKLKEREEIKNLKPNIIKESEVRKWLSGIKNSNYSPQIFIDRIEANTTQIVIRSNFSESYDFMVAGEHMQEFLQLLEGFEYNI